MYTCLMMFCLSISVFIHAFNFLYIYSFMHQIVDVFILIYRSIFILSWSSMHSPIPLPTKERPPWAADPRDTQSPPWPSCAPPHPAAHPAPRGPGRHQRRGASLRDEDNVEVTGA